MRKFADLPKWTKKSFTYAGIGHRDLSGFREPNTNQPVERVMAWLSGRLESLGYTLNSGGAKGADSAFEYGVKSLAKKRIFHPENATDETRAIARELHPSPDHLYPHALDLFARNTFQVFGGDLNTPVDFVVCYTKDGCEKAKDRSQASGGTGQAIAMADLKGIPVFNMSRNDWFIRLKQFLNLDFDLPTGELPAIPADLLRLEKNAGPKSSKKEKQKLAPSPRDIKNLLKAARR